MMTVKWHVKHQQSLTRDQRAADALRNWMFIGVFVAVMLVWAGVNTVLLLPESG
jgi:uncharacterized membrane protein